jgi:trehalose 6-phosphate phosphatase
MKADTSQWVQERLAQAERVWLFLDYDGTLAEFAPTPEDVNPDPELVDLIARLARRSRFRVAVVSGRRLSHVQKLVPVPGVLLAGTYGVELQTPEGARIDRLDYKSVRPTLEALKPQWTRLVGGRQGLFLEDKGWALALHARFADEDDVAGVLVAARRLADRAVNAATPGLFQVLGGHKFLEIGPRLADKGLAVSYLLHEYPWPGALPVYLGDDDKDEAAFGVVKASGGVAVVVASHPRQTQADVCLGSPQAARQWLERLYDAH